jgi:hypothetical protein
MELLRQHLEERPTAERSAEAQRAIQALYETAIDELRRLGNQIKMQPAWMNWLVSTFLAEHNTNQKLSYSTSGISLQAA